MKNIFSLFLLVGLSIFLFSSCDSGIVYNEKSTFENTIWEHDQLVEFKPVVSDTSKRYDLYLTFEHEKSYPFQNLYFRVNHNLFGEEISDTINISFISKNGSYIGKCNEESCSLEAPFLGALKLNLDPEPRISIEQFTRRDTLTGIRELGLMIRESKR